MRWKWIIGLVVILVIVSIGVIFVIVSRYDFNRLKPTIVQTVKEATGRELKLGGDIKLKIGLSPALVVKDVGFQNAPWGSRPQMAEIKRFEVKIALLPLLWKHVEIKRLVLIEPDVLIETDKSGNTNLPLLSAIEKKTVGQGQGPKKQAKEQATEQTTTLPPLLVNQVRISKGHFTYKDARTGKTYSFVLDSFVAGARDTDSPSNISFKGNYNEAPRSKLQGILVKANKESFEGTGELGPVSALMDPNKAWPLKLTLKTGGITATVDGSIRDILKRSGLMLTVSAKGNSVLEVTKLAGMEIKEMPDLGPFTLTGQISDPAAKTYQISDIKLETGGNDLSGSLKIALGEKPPRFSGSLTSKKMDLRALSSEKGKSPEDSEKPRKQNVKKDKIFSNAPLPLDALKKLDGNLKVEVAQLLLPRLALRDLAADLTLEKGYLRVKPLKSTIGGGTLNADVDLGTREKSGFFSTTIEIDRMDIARMLEELDIKEKMEGNLRADAALEGTGDSVAAMMGALNGKVDVVIGKGRFDNKYLKLLGADFTNEALRLLNPFKEEKEYTELNCLVGAFDIKDGLATSKALVCDTNYISIISSGTIDLKTEKLSLSIKPSPKEGVGVSGIGKLSLSLSELAKPLKMGGTLAHPSIGLDPTETAISLGKMAGGTLLFGPIGIAAALLGGELGDKNPCLAAIQAAETGVGSPETTQKEEAKGSKSSGEGAEGAIEDIGKSIKKLFGN